MKLKYRIEIDGLRAIAVIPVILFHVGFELFSGGYSGVDVFFVISGFLITSIIYSESVQHKFSIITFYERRARRILPLLFFILLVSLPLAWISLYQTDMTDYFKSLIAVPTFSSNFLFASEADYFDAAVELKPLLHTWSLAVEEQYYIFFPLLIMIFFRFNQRRALLITILSLCIASFILAEWASITFPKHNFYLLPSRVWELGMGAMLAILMTNRNPFLEKVQKNKLLSEALGVLGLGLIIAGIFVIKSDSPFPSSYTLFPVVGTVLIIAFTTKDSIVGKFLSLKPLVFIGLISYSAYLWHHLLFAFARHLGLYDPSFSTKAGLSIIIIPISYLSWRFIENPFRNKKKYKRKQIFTLSAIGSVMFIGIGFAGVTYEGFPNRPVNKNLEVYHYSADNRKLQTDSWQLLNQAREQVKDGNWFPDDSTKTNLLLIGNSHSKDIYNILTNSHVAKSNFHIGQLTHQIFEFSDSEHPLYSSINYQDAEIVMIASRYSSQDILHLEKLVDALIQDNKTVVIVKEIHNFKVTDGKTEADLLVQQYIRENYDLENSAIIDQLIDSVHNTYYRDFINLSTERRDAANDQIDEIKSTNPSIIVLDRMEYVCDSDLKKCFAINSALEKYFYDYGHNTIEGAEFFGERIDEVNWLEPLLLN